MNNNGFLKLYKTGAVGLILSAVAQLWLGYKSGDSALFATGVTTLSGVLIPAVAGKRLDNQIKDGTFEAPVEVSPYDMVMDNLPVVVEQAARARTEMDRVIEAASAAASAVIPDLGPLAKEAIEKAVSNR